MKIRLLANENFTMPSVVGLRDARYDVLAIAESHRAMADRDVLSLAVSRIGGWSRSIATMAT